MATTSVIDSAEWVWDERATFDGWAFVDAAGIDDSVITTAAISLLKTNLTTAWANEGHTMVDVPAADYEQLIDAEHLPATVIPDLDLCESVWRNALDALDFDDIITKAGCAAEYSAFVHAQDDYNH